MRKGRKVAGAVVGVVGILLLVTAARADTAAYDLTPDSRDVQLRLAADRMFGFAPMKVNLSGMVQMENGDLRPVDAGQIVRLIVDSPLLSVQQPASARVSLVPDLHYESETPGPREPSALYKSIEIRTPGRYMFRVQIVSPDGTVLSSNQVDVRAF